MDVSAVDRRIGEFVSASNPFFRIERPGMTPIPPGRPTSQEAPEMGEPRDWSGLRIAIFEFPAWPGHAWIWLCAKIVGGTYYFGPWHDEDDV